MNEELVNARRQVGFYDALLKARKTVLADALQLALSTVDPRVIRQEIHGLVSGDCLTLLARVGIRDEYVFPAPTLIAHAPTLVGYYRLLLGLPQKTFYGSGTGLGKFKRLEQQGRLTVSRPELESWCQTMCIALCALVRELSPTLHPRDLNDLQIMTLGQQIQGGRNNSIGLAASDGVFAAITALVKDHLAASNSNRLSIVSPSGKRFLVGVSSDPDISVWEESQGVLIPRLAIEIKGGGDGSNVHNRAGEAEKSHLKIKQLHGYPLCWTVIASANHSLQQLAQESPTTDQWFDVLQVIAQSGQSWERFAASMQALLNLNQG